MNLPDGSVELPPLKLRFFLLLAIVFFALLLLVGRLYTLQVLHGEDFTNLSRANIVAERPLPALRGRILDRNGKILADSRPSFNLYLTPAFCKPEVLEPTLARLAEFVGLSNAEIDDTRKAYLKAKKLDKFLPILVRPDVTWTELVAVEQHLDTLDGVEIRSEARRWFPEKTRAAHLIGYVGEINLQELSLPRYANAKKGDIIGKAGVEKGWEEELHGQDGILQEVVDARGRRVPEGQAREILGDRAVLRLTQPGHDLELSLDDRLQALAEQRFSGREGAVVAVEAQTGFILAMASFPAYDPNLFAAGSSTRWWRELLGDPDHPLTNRALQQHYAPGSTFKPFTALAALKTGATNDTQKQVCPGQMRYGDHVFRCWRGGGHGAVALHRALVESCDVYFYRVGIKTTLDPIAEAARNAGLGRLTGFDSGQEVPGIIPDHEWYTKNTKTGFLPGFTVSNSIGQGDVNVTPLQHVLAYAAIGNGGTVYKPQIVRRIRGAEGQILRTIEPVVNGHLDASPEHLRWVADGLIGVVNEPSGTAYWRRPQRVNFQAAGKTGTAQVVGQGADKGRDAAYDLRDHAWFVGWAPAENPRIAVAVINEHGGHGSSAAAPLVMEIITYYLEQLERPDETAQPETR